ncbi:hypothetical protein SARC_16371 [Sphaeroforma arctica JP610]|uniref:WW domain-containing protein n=1 Tax=Sphaeroforma arctica JP610 TaxID=667725 RepID=A0A0L0F306_9EUKA|nr:hypothetical protein SARC_16371 [Sphaeroforma arctica JP610]KNC71090.1 hypothetical protein SARC_16371 [Sphaeroforma arctica JP610]|eukprot:XP_014144992.1 hypothetical protein SARC_16371 [Sphaeroforma arctica JP610]
MSGIQWKECFSRTRNRKYWFNSATGESTWTAPETETTVRLLSCMSSIYRQ